MLLPPPLAQLMWLAEQRSRLAHYLDHGGPELMSGEATARLYRLYQHLQTREADLQALVDPHDALPCDVAAAQTWPRLDVLRPLPDSWGRGNG
jgi:hypothetical protein